MLNLKPLIAAANLGDARRNDRAFELVGALVAGQPLRPSKNASWAHTMGTCRFYDNAAIPLAGLYRIGIAAVSKLVEPGQRVYIAHDGSLVDYSGHNAKSDRIPIGNHRGRGYELYTALVLDAQGRPLGPIFQEVHTSDGCYSSEPLPAGRHPKTTKFIGHIEQMEAAVHAAKTHLPDQERVHLADCEFDDVALERWMVAGEAIERYIVRAQHLERLVLHEGQPTHLSDAADKVRLKRGTTIEKEGVRYRQYTGETEVVLYRPSLRGRHRGQKPTPGPAISVRMVVAELRAREHETIRWILLTNLADPVADIVRAYVFRWKIERYFYLTKIGFQLETWNQQDGGRIARRLAITSLAAMVIYQLLALEDDPAGAKILKAIAKEGNWLGRKSDPIGPQVLMRGMVRILDRMAAIEQHETARIKTLAESIFPGITKELRRAPRRAVV